MSSSSRRGFTTVELVVVLLIGGVVAATIGSVLRRQQRFFTNAATLVEHRVSLRDATAILPAEIRALSPGSGDIITFSDSALEIRATIGAAIACDTVAGGDALDLAPLGTTGAAPLAAYSTSPQPGDIALVFDAGLSGDSTDGAWRVLPIVQTAPLSTVCVGSPLVADAAAPRLRIRFPPGTRASASIEPGAFVHILRRVRYRLYRSSTSDWYLGYSEWDATAFTVVQPVSGPFAAYARGAGASGLVLRYLDDAGAVVTAADDAARIARVEVVARAEIGAGLSATTRAYLDSLTVTVRVRNR
jgi:Tfp pilus assembly protein PilW